MTWLSSKLNATQQRALFRLRALLLWRQLTGEKGRMVGAVIGLLAFGPLAAGLAVASAAAYLLLEAPWPGQILGGILTLLWLIWAVFPLLFGILNPSYDISRLLPYPISRLDLVAGILSGTLLDYPTFLVIPLFLAVLVGWGISPALPVVLVGLPVAYLHMVVIGQIAMTIAGGIMQSRRYRDLALILFSLLSASCYFISEGFGRILEEVAGPDFMTGFLPAWRPLDQLQWLPPGAVARAIEQAAANQWGSALFWLGYALLWLILLGRVWIGLLERLITGQGFLLRAPAERADAHRPQPARLGRLPFLSISLQALTTKELQLAWRIPQRRIGLIQAFLLPAIIGGAFYFSGDWEEGIPVAYLGLILPGYAFISTLGFASNGLSWEGRGLAMLLLTPFDRADLFRSKALVSIVLAYLPVLLLTIPLLLFGETLALLAGNFVALALIGVTTAVALLFSVWFPFPVNLNPTRPFARPERRGGFIPAIMSIIGMPLASAVFGLPLAIPVILVWWFDLPLIGFLTAAAAALYGLILAWAACPPSGRILLKKEPEVLTALIAPEGD